MPQRRNARPQRKAAVEASERLATDAAKATRRRPGAPPDEPPAPEVKEEEEAEEEEPEEADEAAPQGVQTRGRAREPAAAAADVAMKGPEEGQTEPERITHNMPKEDEASTAPVPEKVRIARTRPVCRAGQAGPGTSSLGPHLRPGAKTVDAVSCCRLETVHGLGAFAAWQPRLEGTRSDACRHRTCRRARARHPSEFPGQTFPLSSPPGRSVAKSPLPLSGIATGTEHISDVGVQVQIGGSPDYYVERKLGKGGFGQVYVGRRTVATKDNDFKDGPSANLVRISDKCLPDEQCHHGACRALRSRVAGHQIWLRASDPVVVYWCGARIGLCFR